MGKKEYLRLKHIDWDPLFNEDHVITNHKPTDNKMNFSPDGVFSERIFGKMESDNIQYSCECGKMIGKFFEGTECRECNTEVIFTGPVVQRSGWIVFENYKLIKPLIYKMMEKTIFPQGVLREVINYEANLNLEGELVTDNIDDIRDKDPRYKYYGVGLEYFIENFDEILDYYHSISKLKYKDKGYKFIKENKEHVFIDKMYVVSTILRPALNIGSTRLKYAKVNNYYNNLIYITESLKNSVGNEMLDMNRLPLLFSAQMSANSIYSSLAESIKGKTGFIRKNILGTRLDYSSRNVITPLPPGYKVNETVLPYKTLMELLRPRIINVLVSLKGINHVKANDLWREALLEYNDEFYNIMTDLINKTKGGIYILLNRNPTIAYGGILRLKVVGVKKDITDLTTSINNGILSLMGGDYDGDSAKRSA